jgi:hypothetical protein
MHLQFCTHGARETTDIVGPNITSLRDIVDDLCCSGGEATLTRTDTYVNLAELSYNKLQLSYKL